MKIVFFIRCFDNMDCGANVCSRSSSYSHQRQTEIHIDRRDSCRYLLKKQLLHNIEWRGIFYPILLLLLLFLELSSCQQCCHYTMQHTLLLGIVVRVVAMATERGRECHRHVLWGDTHKSHRQCHRMTWQLISELHACRHMPILHPTNCTVLNDHLVDDALITAADR